MTVTAVARRLGILPSRVSRWEHGIHAPRGDMGEKWDAVLADLTHEKRDTTARIKAELIDPETPAVAMARIRSALGVSALSMSRIMGIDHTTLWRWETGRYIPENIDAWRAALLVVCLGIRRTAIRHGGVQ